MKKDSFGDMNKTFTGLSEGVRQQQSEKVNKLSKSAITMGLTILISALVESILFAVFLTFVLLKSVGVLTFGWAWVFSPLWLGGILLVGLMIFYFTMVVIVAFKSAKEAVKHV